MLEEIELHLGRLLLGRWVFAARRRRLLELPVQGSPDKLHILGAVRDIGVRSLKGWVSDEVEAGDRERRAEDLDVVGLLVASGAVPDVLDSQGDTPESWALEWENFKCAMILSEYLWFYGFGLSFLSLHEWQH